MSNMTLEQFWQTLNAFQLRILGQQGSPMPENETLEMEARYHRTAAGMSYSNLF